MTNHILQWNCRSVKANFEELNLLINENKPVAVCLQETFLKDSDRLTLKCHSCYFQNCTDNDKASGAVAVIVNNSVPHLSVRLDSTLQPPSRTGGRIRRLPSCRVVKPHQWTRLFAVGGDS